MNQPTENEVVTDTAKHWDQTCINLITIATAVLAGAFLVSGIAEEKPQPTTLLTVWKTLGIGLSTVIYAALVVTAGKTIFKYTNPPTSRTKRLGTTSVFTLFATLIASMGITIFAIIIIPPDTPWEVHTQTKIWINTDTWGKLQDLTGDEGTPDQRINRLMNRLPPEQPAKEKSTSPTLPEQEAAPRSDKKTPHKTTATPAQTTSAPPALNPSIPAPSPDLKRIRTTKVKTQPATSGSPPRPQQ